MVHTSGFRPGGSWLFKNRIISLRKKICFGEELRRKNPALGDKKFVAQFVCTFESKTLIIKKGLHACFGIKNLQGLHLCLIDLQKTFSAENLWQ